MTPESRPLGHLKITPGTLDDGLAFAGDCIAGGRRAYAMPLNWTKYVAARTDAKLRAAVLGAGLVIADGKPIQWLGRRLGYRGVEHICGIDLAEALLKGSRSRGWRIYLLGARPENLEKARAFLEGRFGAPLIAGMRDGYFSAAETEGVLAGINAARPDILLLGLGMPQKEYFIHDHLERLDVRFCLPVGGAFDIWSQAKKRSPRLLNRMGLEWLQRSFYNVEKARTILRLGFSYLKEWRRAGR